MRDLDPVDEMREVLRETLEANGLELVGTATHGAPVISERALDELARGLLARRVAEPSRVLAAPPSDAAAPLLDDPKPLHPWNDPDDDGHDCADCPSVSMWKCDRDAHFNGPYSLLTEQERVDLDANLREQAATRRRGNASAATIPLGAAPRSEDAAPHPGENHDYRMTCTRCGEPGYLFVGYHSPLRNPRPQGGRPCRVVPARPTTAAWQRRSAGPAPRIPWRRSTTRPAQRAGASRSCPTRTR